MADDLISRGSINTTIRTFFKKLTSACIRKLILAGYHAFLPLWTHLLYKNISVALWSLFTKRGIHLVDKSSKGCNVRGCPDTRKEHYTFPFAYKTYHPHMCMLAPKLHVNPLPIGIDIRYNTVRQEALPRMDTGQCLLLFHTITIKILSCSLSIFFF